MPRPALSFEEIINILDDYFDVEFSFIKSEEAAQLIAGQPRVTQDFILNLTNRIAATNAELAFQFSLNSLRALESMDLHLVEAWAMSATDNYDRKGLFPAMSVIRDLENYVHNAHVNANGAVLNEEISVLLPFVQGLSGRKLKIAEAPDNHAYTDTETIYLPAITAIMQESKDNFLLYKASVAFLWAQIQCGTFRVNRDETLRLESAKDQLEIFSALEAIRLEAFIRRELPGLYRDMQRLKMLTEDGSPSPLETIENWQEIIEILNDEKANVEDTLRCLHLAGDIECPPIYCYHGIIKIDIVKTVMQKRIEKEKAYFRVALSELAKENGDDTEPGIDEAVSDEPGDMLEQDSAKFDINNNVDEQNAVSGVIELELDGELMPIPNHVKELITSIIVDFGEIPPEYLYAAGPGEYDLKKYNDEELNPNDVWQGTYHEEGAEIYNEWNFKRQHYHKNWCVLRELEVEPQYDDFVVNTLEKHKGLLKSLRHTFEILRGEDKLLKKQVYGDDVDIDALVEAYGDVKSGMEMTDRLFTKMHKEERNVAVIFMVDMSGSTKGWINDAERESLILLAEVLQILDDRFAIYGFSGMTRQRCELYKIKAFDEEYNDEIKARISNIQPKDYTRMGVFIRHMNRIFSGIEASTKLLVTLSDGKPDDYDTYRGEYGVEDTRQALYEAHREGIHSYCITIDEEARDYLPHMYGAANYSVIDDVAQLPLKVSDIYRRLTT
jgi:nitric oxide reductase NorD protein